MRSSHVCIVPGLEHQTRAVSHGLNRHSCWSTNTASVSLCTPPTRSTATATRNHRCRARHLCCALKSASRQLELCTTHAISTSLHGMQGLWVQDFPRKVRVAWSSCNSSLNHAGGPSSGFAHIHCSCHTPTTSAHGCRRAQVHQPPHASSRTYWTICRHCRQVLTAALLRGRGSTRWCRPVLTTRHARVCAVCRNSRLCTLQLPAAARRRMAELCEAHDFSAARAHLIVSRPGSHTGGCTTRTSAE